MAEDHGLRGSPRPELRPTPETPTRNHSRAMYETGESSTAGSLRAVTPSTTSQGRRASGTADHVASGSSPPELPGSTEKEERLARRRSRFRSGGSFLLHEAVGDHSTRRKSRSLLPAKGPPAAPSASTSTHPPRTAEQRHSYSGHHAHHDGLSIGPEQTFHYDKTTPSPRTRDPIPRRSPGGFLTVEPHGTSPMRQRSSHRASLDADSAQIVNMALDLSESRCVASRRNPSQSIPPRLAPLPDSAPRSNIKQHLNQQRRSSRTDFFRSSLSPRSPSGAKSNSIFQQPGFDDYQYHFSESTLARAQKAKDHLELMGEYRRLLQHLPPLKPQQKSNSTSPPQSPGIAQKTFKSNIREARKRGRQYNPLQYVRNRKVRARERKVIDGEKQGFSDVELVRTWIDSISEGVYASSITSGNDTFAMPPFMRAEEADGHVGGPRVRRPRVDWFFDPCDMIADAYWLEQDNHKELIEDRFWRKILPATTDTTNDRPMSKDGNENTTGFMTGQAKPADSVDEFASGHGVRHFLPEQEGLHQAGTRERAKQKIQDLTGRGHKHTNSHGHHDFLGVRRDSISDTDGSDPDSRVDKSKKNRHGRRETITCDSNDLLEKQMVELVNQEAREAELAQIPEHAIEDQPLSESVIIQRNLSKPGNKPISRKPSLVELSDVESKDLKSGSRMSRWKSPLQPGRASFEVADGQHRMSLSDIDMSVPASPYLGAIKDHFDGLGTNPSAHSSRSTSPTRRTLSKVKRKLLDKSRDSGYELPSEVEEDMDNETQKLELPSALEKLTLVTRTTEDSTKSHRSTGSKKYREEEAVGLRSLFKGTRLDTLVRSGASKVGDMIWKKDVAVDSDNELSIQEGDLVKEKSQKYLVAHQDTAHNIKHFHEVLPDFQSINESGRPTIHSRMPSTAEMSRVPSQRSARWEQLKPPRIDIQSSSPSLSPQNRQRPFEGSDGSEGETNQHGRSETDRLTIEHVNTTANSSTLSMAAGRHWSIVDRNPSSERPKLSRREVARLRALLLSSGVKAMEINRRAHELHTPLSKSSLAELQKDHNTRSVGGLPWLEISQLVPDGTDLPNQQVIACEIYPLASRALGMAIQKSGHRWQASADRFAANTSPALQAHIRSAHSRLTDDLSQLTRRATDQADESGRDLVLDQPLKVKHVVDVMEKLLRKRRRRFRWLRRGMWLGVEWVLVGFMWYVWFVVTILRIFLGVGKGVVNATKWLLWI